MVKFYTSNYTYDFPLPTVSLAYFLRYPNPYSKHVVSSDVIERRFDPLTQRLYTTRLHLKKSKLPSAVLRLLPRTFSGSKDRNGDGQSYILEMSTVDVKEGWMITESRNLDWTGVLSVTERQIYTPARDFSSGSSAAQSPITKRPLSSDGRTDVESTVTLRSPLGEQKWKQRKSRDHSTDTNLPSSQTTTSSSSFEDEAPPKVGFFRSWGTQSLQRSIEMIGLRRAEKSQPNAKEGMKVVLERFRQGGLVAILEGMRRDRLAVSGATGDSDIV
jgi:4-amino-4-deoxychorismate lyase